MNKLLINFLIGITFLATIVSFIRITDNGSFNGDILGLVFTIVESLAFVFFINLLIWEYKNEN